MAPVGPDNNSRTEFKSLFVHRLFNVRPSGNGPDRKSSPFRGGIPSASGGVCSGQKSAVLSFRPVGAGNGA